MTQLLKELTEFFTVKQTSGLEQFINSKNPSSAVDVEYWTKEYEQNTQGFHWGRGL